MFSAVFRCRLPIVLALVVLATISTGCSTREIPTSSTTEGESAKDRPPLKVCLVDCPIGRELEIQWQAFSDQPLTIESLQSTDLLNRALDSTDVWIFPSNRLGDFVSEERIGPMTTTAMGKLPEFLDPSSPSTKVTDAWPARWRGATRYGNAFYAISLGSKPLAIVSKNLPLGELSKIEGVNERTEDLAARTVPAWKSILKQLEASTSQADQMPPKALTDEEKERLVDVFLTIASTTNARYRGLFDLSKMSARLDSPDLVQAAEFCVQLYRASPSVILLPPQEAWQSVLKSNTPIVAIARPGSEQPGSAGSESQDRAAATDNQPIEFSSLTWNPSRGVLAAVGKKTRQTAVSNQFVGWLSEPEQRAAFSKLDDRIELWPGQPDPASATREDYRRFGQLCQKDKRPEPPQLALRFANSDRFAEMLGDTLEKIIREPQQAKSLLSDCSRQWNAFMEQTDAPKQRRSIELSMGIGL
jgi:hypothetical protein